MPPLLTRQHSRTFRRTVAVPAAAGLLVLAAGPFAVTNVGDIVVLSLFLQQVSNSRHLRRCSRLCVISRSSPPSNDPRTISAAVGTAPAPVASPSKSAPATYAMTITATASTRTSCRIS